MPKYVIDTNVPIVANGHSGASIECRLAAVSLLLKAVESGVVYLDDDGHIQSEYRTYLDPRGQPGVGDRFYREVLNSDPGRVQRVDLPRNEEGHYVDLPQEVIDAGFDPSDRVFAALAKKVKGKVYNAVDTDWLESRAVIEQSGIQVHFVCGDDPSNWLEK